LPEKKQNFWEPKKKMRKAAKEVGPKKHKAQKRGVAKETRWRKTWESEGIVGKKS